MDFLYFPTTSIVALIWTTQDGAASALATTGNQGLVGKPALIGTEKLAHRVVVQIAGNAYRVRSEVARWVFDQGGEFPSLVILHTQFLMNQIARTALCSRYHTVEQPLCRWLLLCLDRLPGMQLDTTQAIIASTLKVLRAAVSQTADKLQAAVLGKSAEMSTAT